MSFNKYRLKGAYHYDWYKTEEWYKDCVDRIVKFCKSDILDLGCGDGIIAHVSNEFVTGVDNDPDAIRLAKEHNPRQEFLLQSIDEPISGDWDYMACFNAIEHFDHPERVREILRNHINKGAIIITIDWQGGAFGEDHKHEYTLDELMEFFKEFTPQPFRFGDSEWIGVEILK